MFSTSGEVIKRSDQELFCTYHAFKTHPGIARDFSAKAMDARTNELAQSDHKFISHSN